MLKPSNERVGENSRQLIDHASWLHINLHSTVRELTWQIKVCELADNLGHHVK
jgi:hypothetical protein